MVCFGQKSLFWKFKIPKCLMSVYISEPIMLRKNVLAINQITLALPRALSLCFDTTLSLQAIAMIFFGILHINLALQKYCWSSFIPHTPSRLAWKIYSGNWALVATTALMKMFQLQSGHLFYPDLWKDVVLNVSWHLWIVTRHAVAIIGCKI